ncbi:tetratricopeptide repeat protein [Mucilaginibacter myungsuensis]|uniref:Tetratricopeptide repeat protein n=1 Tax=Mucilaginibacter myungsuensis TaxID=649104 RepID=A0A929KXA3_9SPHI|nr:hypothetical protein [Mucilaginibacter myungsuensis]MBE9660360.1 hypothetical protein [Mucilaginibacter myungsuensis]MDN3600402.1 hypothetical protein [Mucilaginibacter myungsuensis]
MNIKFLTTGLLGLATMTAVAQNSELTSAQNDLNKYETMKTQQTMAKLAISALDNAKSSIDKASVHEKTATLPKTFALRAGIYAALALNDDKPESSKKLFATSDEALKKAKELDTKGEFKVIVENAGINLAQYSMNSGVKEYEAKNFEAAYKSFDHYRTLRPEDTTAIYYTGLAASNYQNYDAAIANYTKLLTTGYSQKEGVYSDVTNFYLQKKTNADSLSALKTLEEAIAKYPKQLDFNRFLIDLNLRMGKQREVLGKIESALAADPKNKTYYQYAGLLYTQIGDEANNKLMSLKDAAEAKRKEDNKKAATTAGKPKVTPKGAKAPAAAAAPAKAEGTDFAASIATQTQIRDENLKKAEDTYRKLLEIDPNDYDGLLNLGYVLNIPAIELYYAAPKIPIENAKEFAATEKKSAELFEIAKPFLLKAVEMKPNDVSALNNLRNYYIGTKNTAKATEIKQKIEAAKAAGK